MKKTIYIIAGEASGDTLGAQLMRALKLKNSNIQFHGIGGTQMMEEGMASLFSMQELSIMGIVEILPKIPQMLKRINQTVRDIESKNPDIVITIDAPDFSFRVQKKLKQRARIKPKQIHYVAPTVWAWKPKRAKKIAKFLDGIICLFPFEPQYFKAEGLEAVAVGHSMMETNVLDAKPLTVGKNNTPKLGVFFGSRNGEIKRLSPVIIDAIQQLSKNNPTLELIIPTLPHLKDTIESITSSLDTPCHIFTDPKQKWPVFKSCDSAIAVSGTVGLELAAANIPHLITYKVNNLTYQILKRVIKTKYAHLVNIILQKEIVPEFIQQHCTANNISNTSQKLLTDETARRAQTDNFEIVRKKIGQNEKPSHSAANFILNL